MPGMITEGFGESPSGLVTGFQIVSVTAAANQLTIGFTIGLPPTSLTGPSANPSAWIVTPDDGGEPVTVLAVAIVGSTVVLTTTNQSPSAYTLTIPLGIMTSGTALLGPFTFDFTGAVTTPVIAIAVSIEAHVLDVHFTVEPDASLSEDPTQYSTSPTLSITAVQKISSTVYRLTTSRQNIGTTYTLTWPA